MRPRQRIDGHQLLRLRLRVRLRRKLDQRSLRIYGLLVRVLRSRAAGVFVGRRDRQPRDRQRDRPGYSDSYDETLHSIGFYQPTFTHPSTFDYVYPTRVGMLEGGLGEGCGCGCGLSGFETWVPIGAQQDTTSTSTIGRLPSGGLIAPAPLPAAWAFHGYLRSVRDVPESPHQVRAAGLSSFRTPSAIHGNGSPSLPQNEIFAAWGQWRERGRLNQDLEDAIAALANLIAPPASGTRPAKLEMPGVVVLDLYDFSTDDQSVTLSVGSYFHDAAAPYALRAPEGPDALVDASLDGGSLTISVPDGSTADGLTAVTVVSKNAAGLPVSWTVLVHVVAVEGYTVQEQAWGETTWHAPEDHGDDWALLWQSNDTAGCRRPRSTGWSRRPTGRLPG
jgi:hypothetical protein